MAWRPRKWWPDCGFVVLPFLHLFLFLSFWVWKRFATSREWAFAVKFKFQGCLYIDWYEILSFFLPPLKMFDTSEEKILKSSDTKQFKYFKLRINIKTNICLFLSFQVSVLVPLPARDRKSINRCTDTGLDRTSCSVTTSRSRYRHTAPIISSTNKT